MSKNAIDGLKKGINSILAVRDKIGVIENVYLVTRTYSGPNVGVGQYTDITTQILPTPGIKKFAQDIRVTEASAVQQGDIILTGISKVNYPDEVDIDCSTQKSNVERFYLIGDKEYQVKFVDSSYVTWSVQLRKRSGKAK